jgi:hypothetical protein
MAQIASHPEDIHDATALLEMPAVVAIASMPATATCSELERVHSVLRVLSALKHKLALSLQSAMFII